MPLHDQPVVNSRDIGFEPKDVSKHRATGGSAYDALHQRGVAAQVDVDGMTGQHAANARDPRQTGGQFRRMHVRLSVGSPRSVCVGPKA